MSFVPCTLAALSEPPKDNSGFVLAILLRNTNRGQICIGLGDKIVHIGVYGCSRKYADDMVAQFWLLSFWSGLERKPQGSAQDRVLQRCKSSLGLIDQYR